MAKQAKSKSSKLTAKKVKAKKVKAKKVKAKKVKAKKVKAKKVKAKKVKAKKVKAKTSKKSVAVQLGSGPLYLCRCFKVGSKYQKWLLDASTGTYRGPYDCTKEECRECNQSKAVAGG